MTSEPPPAVSARGASVKGKSSSSQRRRPASKKGSSIEPAPLTAASPRVGLESGGWRKPETDPVDAPVAHAAGDVDERFFADGDKPLSRTGGKTTFSDLDEPDLRAMLKNAPGAQKRRERYARFVRWVVVAGVAVLTAGLVRVAIAKREYQPVPRRVPVAEARAESPAAQAGATPSPQAAQAAANPAPEAPAPAAAPAPAPTEAAKPAEEASPAAAATGTPEENAQAAKQAKKDSQHALEMGKTQASIEAGERAVGLDPTDAESWLILGAAYQQAGKLADAKRCFKSCLTLGTHGPKGECAAFPH